MDNTMLFTVLREFTTGLLNQLLVNLAGEDGQKWFDEFKKFLRQEPCWVAGAKVHLKRLFANEVIKFDDVEIVGYQLIKNATLMSMLKDIGEKRRCWEDNDEILRFSRAHKDKLGSNGNFFEHKDGFIVDVRLDGAGQLYVHNVYPLSDGDAWDAECVLRVFSPQQ